MASVHYSDLVSGISAMTKLRCDVLVIMHRMFIGTQRKKGGLDIIVEYLLDQGKTVCMLEYQMAGKMGLVDSSSDSKIVRQYPHSVLSVLAANSLHTIREFRVFPQAEPFRWGSELIYTPWIVSRYLERGIPICMTADPLCTLAGMTLQTMGFVRTIYFHSIDYSDSRFPSKLLNAIYLHLYRYAVNRADFVGLVSRPMFDKCASFVANRNKLIYVPNTPDFSKVSRVDIGRRERFSLVVVANGIMERYEFEKIVYLIARVKEYFPQVRLKAIGATDMDSDYFGKLLKLIARLDLQKNVVFYGFLSKENAQRIVASSHIGLALYSPTISHIRYGDSLKIREYAACGLPTVADRKTATAREAAEHEAGFACQDEDEMVEAVKWLWNDEQTYQCYSFNALAWAEKFDKAKILQKLVKRLVNRATERKEDPQCMF